MPVEPADATWIPYSCRRTRSTSITSTSMTTSGRALSMAAISFAAAATRSGVSFKAMAFVPATEEILRASTTIRSRSIVSFSSALDR